MRRIVLCCSLSVAFLLAGWLSFAPIGAASTITVTTAADTLDDTDGLCSLREAIIAANTDSAVGGCPGGSGADTIAFSPALAQPLTLVLTRTGANENGAMTGDLDISGTLALNSPGPGNLVIDGNGADRVLEIMPGARVTILGVTIQNGNADALRGGGIAVDLTGVLTMSHSTVVSNTALSGGGIMVLGKLVMSTSTVANNQGGGITNDGGSLVLRDTEVSGNTGGYGVLNQNAAHLTFEGGQVSGNQGGGIYNLASSAMLSRVNIVNNTGGGGVHSMGMTPAHSHLAINQCVIMTNTATSGGGIYSYGTGATATIYNTRISGNIATTAGGGVYNNGLMTLNGSTVDHNQARSGGGIDHSGGNLNLTNDTLSGNAAQDNGGGLYNRSGVILTNVTFNANTANGPGTGGNIFNDTAQLTIRNSIVAGSEADGNCFNSDGSLISGGHNLDSANTCGFAATGDITNTNPLVGSLQNNGGATPTHALLPGSPAIDKGDNALCPATDQRGLARPQGAACDIGAYEYGASTDLSITMRPLPDPIGVGERFTYTLIISNFGPLATGVMTITDVLPPSVTFISLTMDTGGLCMYGDVITCTLANLNASLGLKMSIVVTAPGTSQIITNTAWVASTTPDLYLDNNLVATVTPIVQIRKTYLPLVQYLSASERQKGTQWGESGYEFRPECSHHTP